MKNKMRVLRILLILHQVVLINTILFNSSCFSSSISVLGGGCGGRFTDVEIDPYNSDIVYVSGNNTGIWKSTNGGESWTSLNNNGVLNYIVTDIEMDPQKKGTIYLATHGGPFISTNSGKSWTSLRSSGFPPVSQKWAEKYYVALSCIEVCPQDNRIILVGCGHHKFAPSRGLLYAGYISKDSGQNWRPFPNGKGGPDVEKPLAVSSVSWNPNDSNQIYMATTQGLFMSNNSGDSWSKLSNGLEGDQITKVKAVPNIDTGIFVAIGTIGPDKKGGIFYSSNGGDNFARISPEGSFNDYPCLDFQIMDKDGEKIYSAFNPNIAYTDNRGETWQNFGSTNNNGFNKYAGNAVFQFKISDSFPRVIYTVSDSIIKSDDDGQSWKEICSVKLAEGFANRNLVNTSVSSILIDPADKRHILLAELDRGISQSFDSGKTWKSYFEYFKSIDGRLSDCFDLDIDSSGNLYALLGTDGKLSFSLLMKSSDGINWNPIKEFGGPYSVLAVAEYKKELKVFVGVPGYGLYWSGGPLTDWKVLSIGNEYPEIIRQDPIDKTILYAGFRFGRGAEGGLFKSKDFGATWKPIGHPSLKDVWALDICIANNKVLFAGTSNYAGIGKGGLFRSTDGGQNWKLVDASIKIEYEDIGAVAKRRVKSVSFNRDGSILLFGYNDGLIDYNNQKGVYFSKDRGTTFHRVDNLPIEILNTITPDRDSLSTFWIGTEGGGAYKVDLE